MEIKGDAVRISTADRAVDGSPIEPEEHLAEHIIQLDAPMKFQTGEPMPAGVPGVLPGSFDYQTTAGDLAVALRHRCSQCKHWNVPGWRRLRRQFEASGEMDKRQFVNEVRFAIEQLLPEEERSRHSDESGDLDLEHVLDAMGLCNVITEILSKSYGQLWPVVQLSAGGCPDHKGPHGEDLSDHFQARDREAEKIGAQVYDGVLGMTEGKMPGQT